MATLSFAQVLIILICLHMISGASSVLMMTIRSSCDDTIWPAIVSKSHSPELISKNTTGFALRPGESKTVSAPDNWAGTLWGRTHCGRNATGKFTCRTGDCGSYAVEYPGGAAAPAATTLADFTPKGVAGDYAYFVSLAKGFNLAVTVVPRGDNINDGGGSVESAGSNCGATGCVADLNKECPKEVEVVLGNDVVIGCNSACEAFKESRDHYCGRPSTYSDHFKRFCPLAQAFQNDKTSSNTFQCSSADYYDVNFCASSFPPSPPPSRSSRSADSADGYNNYNIPGEEELSENSGKNFKIIGAVLGSITGAGLLSLLGHFIWNYCLKDQNFPLCKLKFICTCCNHWDFCNCCNSSSDVPDPAGPGGGTSALKHDDHCSINPKIEAQVIRRTDMERV